MTLDSNLSNDPTVRNLSTVDGFKVLEPCLLYDKIGEGGMGTVYRGKHIELDIEVAIKCLSKNLATNEEYVSRFQQEAQTAAKINHPNLIRVYSIRENCGIHYMVMEYVEGETASQRVFRKGRLQVEEAVEIIRQSSAGLASAHRQGIVHRDIKPANLLISTEGVVKVADLGLAKLTSAEGITQSGFTLGTPNYMAPEQWESFKHTGPAADVWALGVTLYYLLTGKPPFSAEEPPELSRSICNDPTPDITIEVPEIQPELKSVILRCLEKQPEKRYYDAKSLLGEIEGIIGPSHKFYVLSGNKKNSPPLNRTVKLSTAGNSNEDNSPQPRRKLRSKEFRRVTRKFILELAAEGKILDPLLIDILAVIRASSSELRGPLRPKVKLLYRLTEGIISLNKFKKYWVFSADESPD